MKELVELWYENAICGMQPWDGQLHETNFTRAIQLDNYTVVVTVGGNN